MAGRGANGLSCSRKKHRLFRNSTEIIDALTPDQFIELRLWKRQTALRKQRPKAIPVIEWEVMVQVLLVREGQSFFLGNSPESFHVDRIVICEDPVEIEDQGTNHAAS